MSQLTPRLWLIAASRAVLAACDVQQRSAYALQRSAPSAQQHSAHAQELHSPTALSSAQHSAHAQSTQLTL